MAAKLFWIGTHTMATFAAFTQRQHLPLTGLKKLSPALNMSLSAVKRNQKMQSTNFK